MSGRQWEPDPDFLDREGSVVEFEPREERGGDPWSPSSMVEGGRQGVRVFTVDPSDDKSQTLHFSFVPSLLCVCVYFRELGAVGWGWGWGPGASLRRKHPEKSSLSPSSSPTLGQRRRNFRGKGVCPGVLLGGRPKTHPWWGRRVEAHFVVEEVGVRVYPQPLCLDTYAGESRSPFAPVRRRCRSYLPSATPGPEDPDRRLREPPTDATVAGDGGWGSGALVSSAGVGSRRYVI